jgi:hypothetical protein
MLSGRNFSTCARLSAVRPPDTSFGSDTGAVFAAVEEVKEDRRREVKNDFFKEFYSSILIVKN